MTANATNKMLNSIRIRLALWFTGILALVLIAFAIAAYLFLGYSASRQTDRTLRELSHSFTDMIESERDEKNGRRSEAEATSKAVLESIEDLRFRNYQVFVFDSNNAPIAVESGTNSRTVLTVDQLSGITSDLAGRITESAYYDLQANGGHFRILATRYPIKGQTFSVVVTHSLDEELELQGRFLSTLAISVPIALLLACFGGYFLARKALSPVVAMSDSASQISSANLNERLPIRNEKDELGSLATVFNSMLDRLERSFEQQRRFMADASHELRTPLAIVRGESEVALLKNDRTIGDYKESLEIVHDESKRLTKIVEDLFTLARADAGQFQTNFAPVYLDEIAGDAVRSVRVLADKKDIDVTFSADSEMPFKGDETLIHRLFLNLLDNAIKYSENGGRVSVNGTAQNGSYSIEVSDKGIGIPPEDSERIFDRFYRLDKARSRSEQTSTSGAGLGLSIAQWIAEIHGGQVRIKSSGREGSVFVIELPRGASS